MKDADGTWNGEDEMIAKGTPDVSLNILLSS